MAFSSVSEIAKFIADEDVKFVDIRFTDVPGKEHQIGRAHV